eukprot:TRINITY_DN20952_c0_g1_i1.p1 TRINITY_DN20952_c0_g1~~TRINITY_DN20952_c0_g1_i1.p1  ORF type:complete len:603 (-),score=59.55 TRINITY_DN20952_c0_g1_i1:191-1999(-)
MPPEEIIQFVVDEAAASAVDVWLRSYSDLEPPTCASWLRTGSCPLRQCYRSHSCSLVGADLRMVPGASTATIVPGDPMSVREDARDGSVAFILFNKKAIYDHEDEAVAQTFLRERRDASQVHDNSCMSQLWSAMPLAVAVDALNSAYGFRKSLNFTAVCRAWRDCPAAQGLRNSEYVVATFGGQYAGCSPSMLAETSITVSLVKNAMRDCYTERCVIDSDVHPVYSAWMPSVCIALVLDYPLVFVVLVNGDVRCHCCITGDMLDSTKRKKLPKGRAITCAVLLEGYAIVLGDDGGGLSLVSRDDMSEFIQLRAGAPAAVAALSQLTEKQDFCAAHDGGDFEVLRVTSQSRLERIVSVSMDVDMASMRCMPALARWNEAYCDMVAVVFRADCVRMWQGDDILVQPSMIQGADTAIGNADCTKSDICRCCAVILESVDRPSAVVVTASSATSMLHWWSVECCKNSTRFCGEGFSEPRINRIPCGCVSALTSVGDLALAYYESRHLIMWQGATRSATLILKHADDALPVFAMCEDTVLMAFRRMSDTWYFTCGRLGESESCEEAQEVKRKQKKTRAPKQNKPSDKEAREIAKLRGNKKYGKGYSV